jgi:hypothetical protein
MTACLIINAARAGSPGHLVAEYVSGRSRKRWRTVCGVLVCGVPQPVGHATCTRCTDRDQ